MDSAHGFSIVAPQVHTDSVIGTAMILETIRRICPNEMSRTTGAEEESMKAEMSATASISYTYRATGRPIKCRTLTPDHECFVLVVFTPPMAKVILVVLAETVQANQYFSVSGFRAGFEQ